MKIFITGLVVLMVILPDFASARKGLVSGKVLSENNPLGLVNVELNGTSFKTITDNSGAFRLVNVPEGSYTIIISFIGYENIKEQIIVKEGAPVDLLFK